MSAIKDIPDNFQELIATLGIEFDEGDLLRIGLFLDLLYETNKVMNLTAIKSIPEAWVKHVADSLTLLPFIAEADGFHVVDIGSGGGLPAIPLAITMPENTFTLVETTKKKAMFLSHVVDELKLDNVTVLAERAENLATPDGGFRNIADVVTARAVGNLSLLLEISIPFLREDGLLLAVKGEKAPEEVRQATKAMHVLKATLESSTRTETGTILSIRKVGPTPKKYPRVAGEPKRSPIGGNKK